MKIIQVHNYYQQAGGEDAVVAAERKLLSKHALEVVTYYKNNEAVGNGLWALGKASLQTIWNYSTYREFRQLLRCEKPDIVHCHNTFPIISPSIYWACAKEGIPVVQTLHNYRLLCLNAFLFRLKQETACGKQGEVEPQTINSPLQTCAAGAICELCLRKRLKWPGVQYACYRESKAGSLVVALMLLFHKLIGTWSKKISAYIVLTEFQKHKMIEGGLPAEKIWVKPNFIDDSMMNLKAMDARKQSDETELSPDISSLVHGQQCYALFVGRLSPEKGGDVLIRAWARFKGLQTARGEIDQSAQLIIVGDGPEREALEKKASDLGIRSSVIFLGRKAKNEVLSLMRAARFLVSPSVCYETFGLVVLEAGILSTPSIVAEPGTIAALVDNGRTGLLFSMGDDEDLAVRIAWAWAHPEEMQAMGASVRCEFKGKYSAAVNAQQLMKIYDRASGNRSLSVEQNLHRNAPVTESR